MKASFSIVLLWMTSALSVPVREYDSDSLKPVIELIEKREKELEPLYIYEKEPEEEIIFMPEDYGQQEDIGYGYQKSGVPFELANFKEHYPYLSNDELEKLMLDYLEKGRPKENYYVYGKAKKSVFRERDESDYSENLQRMSPDDDRDEENFKEDSIYKSQSPFRERFRQANARSNSKHDINNADLEYLSALNTLWEQYQHKQDINDNSAEEDVGNDRSDNIELSEDDIAAILSYFEDKNDDEKQFEGNYGDNDDYPVVYIKNDKYLKHEKSPQKRIWRDGAFESYPGYGATEKFLVKKRSLKTLLHDDLKRKKKATESKQKEPNTEKELNKIFGENDIKNKTETKAKHETETSTTVGQIHPTSSVTTEKPILVKKKSVDWSNYFGYDKRKKKSYRNHVNGNWPADQYLNKFEAPVIVDPKEMDEKLREMEDAILDQVIKFTGAHEGLARNPEQLHRIKQKILAQLATAYNLEKMRSALDGFKNIDDQKYDNKYAEKRIALKKQLMEPKDSGVTLEDSNSIPIDLHPGHPPHAKKSFFRRNNPKFTHEYGI